MATRLPKDYSPSEKEPFMNAKQKEFFRRKLLDWRSDIIQETKETLNNLQKKLLTSLIWLIEHLLKLIAH